MKHIKNIVSSLVFLSFLAASISVSAGEGKKSGINWLDFETAIAQGKKQNRMIVVDFYTDWCTWCKVMDEKTYGNAQVIAFGNKKAVFAKVNAESDKTVVFREHTLTYRQLAQAFGVSGYPATLFLTAEGDALNLIPGYIPADKFLPIMAFLEGEHYKTTTFEEFLKTFDKKTS